MLSFFSRVAHRVTIYTVLFYLLGIFFIQEVMVVVQLLRSEAMMMNFWSEQFCNQATLYKLATLAFLLVVPYLFRSIFYQAPSSVNSFGLTCFVFGLIHGYTWQAVNQTKLENGGLLTLITPQFFSHESALQSAKTKQLPLFSIYWAVMCIYYYGEFQLNNYYHHAQLCWKCTFTVNDLSLAFLIYHSKPYFAAMIFSLLEHILTKYVFQLEYKVLFIVIYPFLQNNHPFVLIGFVVMLIGQSLRLTAFFTCKSNFTHIVRDTKHSEHQLITHGVYSVLRHPSYTGYFYFSVASQVFLGNWVSSVAFAIVLIRFFTERIDYEQHNLAYFFKDYLYYKKRTYIGIPFVKSPQSQEILKYLIARGTYQVSNYNKKCQ